MRLSPVHIACLFSLIHECVSLVTNSSAMTMHQYNHTSSYTSSSSIPRSRRKRSIIFPTGSDLEFSVSLQIPIAALSETSTTFDIDIPFTYDLPDSTSSLLYTGRKIEEDHAAVFEMGEDLLNKFGINGKDCIMRTICEMAESRGLPFNGLLGKAFETLFLMDYGLTSTERLYEYISARTYGENNGNCASVYTGCPFSIFNLLPEDELSILQSSHLHNIP